MIYCVEDDASIREIEIYTLHSTGFEAAGFENGAAFFTALKEKNLQRTARFVNIRKNIL